MTKRVFDWSEIRRYLPTKIALSERLPPGIRGELLRPKVALAMPKGAGYVGTYAPIQLKLDPASGLTLDDLDFVVTSGAAGGMVSRSQERSAVASRPTVLLLHGYQPGVHVLEVRHHGSGVVLARRKFTVTDQWADDVNGPNLWFSGTVDTPTVAPTWGGGPGTAQNFATVPATGTRRIAVVFVDTSDQRYTTDAPTLAGFQARWQQNAFTGVVGADGVSRSTAAFYGEVSYGNLTVTGTVFSTVVNLPNGWSSYFQIDPRNNMWQAKNEFVNQVVTQANSQSTTANPFNLTGFDMVVCVTQAVTPATGTARVAWPYGGYGVSAATTFGTVSGRGISMPNEWGDGSANDQGGGRTIFQTLAHEMGHTLNLPDLYAPTVAGRNVGGWWRAVGGRVVFEGDERRGEVEAKPVDAQVRGPVAKRVHHEGEHARVGAPRQNPRLPARQGLRTGARGSDGTSAAAVLPGARGARQLPPRRRARAAGAPALRRGG